MSAVPRGVACCATIDAGAASALTATTAIND
jgi:hypothetical protein